jgi:hypothetical protein
MAKIDIAIALIKLLNERKAINSKLVASELNVSLRTAQRYIKGLSALPCFSSDDNRHQYELLPDYKFKQALLNTSICEMILKHMNVDYRNTKVNQVFCFVCGINKSKILQTISVFDKNDLNNVDKFMELVTNIRHFLDDCNNSTNKSSTN